MEIKIDEELRALIPPLSKDEYKQLEENIKQWGCLDPLKIWPVPESNKIVLLDGHNRFAICSEHKLHYFTESVPLTDRAAAINWMIANQLGRRNLSAEQVVYLRGIHYQKERQEITNPDGIGGRSKKIVVDQNDSQPQKSTAARLAKQHKVSEGTIKRDAKYAEAVDVIVSVTNPQIRQQILAGELKLTQADTLKLARLAKQDPEAMPDILKKIRQASNRTFVSAVVQRSMSEIKEFLVNKKMSRLHDFKDATDAINWLRERFTVTELAESFAKQASESESVEFFDGENKSSMAGHATISNDGRGNCYN